MNFNGMIGLTHGFVLKSNALKSPRKLALVDWDRGRRYTYSELNSRINRLANSFLGLGLQKGDKVALLMRDRAEFVELVYALGKIGVVWVPLNYRSLPKEMEFIIDNSDSVMVVYETRFAEAIAEMKPRLTQVRSNGYVLIDGQEDTGVSCYEDLVVAGAPEEPKVEVEDTNQCSLIYSSGTTGGPKGAMRSHRTSFGWVFDLLLGLELNQRDKVLNPFPFCHQGGSVCFLAPFLVGATVYIPGMFEPRKILQIIQDEKISVAALAPTMTNFILNIPREDRAKYDVSSLLKIQSGSAPLLTSTKEALLQYFSNAGLYDQYSCTEAFYTEMAPEDAVRKVRCVGQTAFGMEIKILDDAGNEVLQGETGAIYCRGISVFDGFYKNPEANQRQFMNGWFTAEDIGYFDEEGYLYVVDRKKDMILSGGLNIASVDVENVLSAFPKVAEAAAIGIPDATWGECVHAFVVLKSGEASSFEEIIAWCNDQLAGYKHPRSMDFVEELPKNTVGKILKRVLRERYSAG